MSKTKTMDLEVPEEITQEYLDRATQYIGREKNLRIAVAGLIASILRDERLTALTKGVNTVIEAVSTKLSISTSELKRYRTVAARFSKEYICNHDVAKDIPWNLFVFVARLPEKLFGEKMIREVVEYLHHGRITVAESREFLNWYATHYEFSVVSEAWREFETAQAKATQKAESEEGSVNTESDTGNPNEDSVAHSPEQVVTADLEARNKQLLAEVELLNIQNTDLRVLLKEEHDKVSNFKEEHAAMGVFLGKPGLNPAKMAAYLKLQAKTATIPVYQEIARMAGLFFSEPEFKPAQLLAHMENLKSEEELYA